MTCLRSNINYFKMQFLIGLHLYHNNLGCQHKLQFNIYNLFIKRTINIDKSSEIALKQCVFSKTMNKRLKHRSIMQLSH